MSDAEAHFLASKGHIRPVELLNWAADEIEALTGYDPDDQRDADIDWEMNQ